MKFVYLCSTVFLFSFTSLFANQVANQEVEQVTDAAPAKAAPENPALTLKNGIDSLITFLRTEPAATDLAGYLEKEIAPNFDFAFMARAAAGPMFRHLSEEQVPRLEKKLQVMFLTAMAEKLAEYDNQDVAYLPPRRNRQGQVMVSVLVNNPGRYPGRIDFRMHQSKDGWRVYDVVGNGASALAFYRNYFRRVMR